jgi:multidrug efflux system membrane fusion protein
MVRSCITAFVMGVGLLVSGGCRHPSAQVAPPEPPALPVSKPVQREVTNYADFTGRAEAVEAVDIRPRVTGYLLRMPFKEGSDVKKGDVLFEIDPEPYKAQLDQAQSQVELNQASYNLAQITYERDLPLAASAAITKQQLDQDKAAVEEAAARIKAAKALVELYKLNLAYTKVTSPIDGRVSRYYLTGGNLVNQDQTLLTTVVSLDPMHVYFDMDEPSLLRFKPKPGDRVVMGLQGEDGFPHRGMVNFVNNQVNPATGSITIRGVFDNPQRLLSPGMFVRVRLPIGQPHQALLIIDRAIGSDQGLKFVYVVDAEHKIQQRRVTTGALQEDGLRVITQGLKADDWVLVGGLQQVRPRMQIQPEPTAMPTLGGQAATPNSGAPPDQPKTPTSGVKQ